MNKYLDYLKNPLIAGLVAGLIIAIIAYVDQRMNDREFENSYYGKLFSGVFILVTSLVYFAKSGTNIKQMSGGNSTTVVKKLGSNGLDVYTDIPDF